MTYLITGASGSVGRSIVAQLLGQGHNVRVVTRDRHRAPKGVEIIEGDFTQGQLPREAFNDVRKVFIFPAQPGVARHLKQLKQAGIEHAVVLSSLAAAMNHERDRDSISALHHGAIERSVAESGIPFTFLRPGNFANNLLFWAKTIQASDTVFAPFPNSAQTTIHEADVAGVAVAALTGEGHEGKIYPMTGPESLTRVEQLQTIGAAIGRTLHLREISAQTFEQEMQKFIPRPIIKMLLDYWSDTVTAPDEILPTVKELTGKNARPLAEWAKDHAHDFSGQETR